MKKLRFSMLVCLLAVVTSIKAQEIIFYESFEDAQNHSDANWVLNSPDFVDGTTNGVTKWLVNNYYAGGKITVYFWGFPIEIDLPNTPPQPNGISFPNGNYLHTNIQDAFEQNVYSACWAKDGGLGILKGVDGVSYVEILNGISTKNYKDVTISFWWLNGAPKGNGDVIFSIDGGTNWYSFGYDFAATTNWTFDAFISELFDNQEDLRIGFRFSNLIDGVNSLGFAIDDITISGTPVQNQQLAGPGIDPNVCGLAANSFKNFIYADNTYPNATKYKFKFTSAGQFGNEEFVYETSSRFFRLQNAINNLKWNEAYLVSVAAYVDGKWTEYGNACAIITPEIPKTKIQASDCERQLESFKDYLIADQVLVADGYKFKIEGVTIPYAYEYIPQAKTRVLQIWQIPDLLPNATYKVQVAVKIKDKWGQYGEACIFKTPVVTTKLADQSCNAVLNSNDIIYVKKLRGAIDYKYEFKGVTSPYYFEITRNSNAGALSLYYVKGLQKGETYNVRVSANIGGIWSPWGEVCTITIPKQSKSSYVSNQDVVEIAAYPNPTSDVVTITSNTQTSCLILNSLGQVIKSFELNENNNYQVTIEDLPAGIYTVNARNNNDVKTEKFVVIK